MLSIPSTIVNEILDNVKLLLNIERPTDNTKIDEYKRKIDIITLYIQAICTNILIKTNRRTFVEDLKYVAIDMIVDKFNSNKTDAELQSIQSMSEYDRSVNFGVSNVQQTKLNLIAQKQVEDNEKLINRYRLLYRI